MADVLLFGEPMAMFVADQPGPFVKVDHYTRMLAGAEVNVAIGLTRLGWHAAYITRLGEDPFGYYIQDKLREAGIEGMIRFDPTYPTGFQLKSKAESGDPEVFYFRKNSAASHLSAADIDAAVFSQAKHLHITGIPPALSESCREATFYMISMARERGMSISFDPNLRPSLWRSEDEMIETINRIAEKVDIVLPGIHEGKILTGLSEAEEIADFYLRKGADTVFVKCGGNGAYYADKDQKGMAEGFAVEKIVDTVGAGDGFAVGVISAYLEGLGIKEQAARGNAIGAMQLMVKGDNEGLPTREQLSDFISDNSRVKKGV